MAEQNQDRVCAEISPTLFIKFKHCTFDAGISQKNAIAEAIQLWIDNR